MLVGIIVNMISENKSLMKVRNPKSRNHLKLPKSYKVLEVGGGHDPHKRSNLIVDKYVDSNFHRCGDVKVYRHQQFLQADGENLPFEDNQFDYVMCNHVLEHVDDPIKFLKEQSRVAKRGYLEIPSLMGEYLHPKISHRWLILEIDNKIVMMDKELAGFKPTHDLGEIFLDYLPRNSIGYKIIQNTHANLDTVRYEWEGEIDVIVNPTEMKYAKYFLRKWEIDDIQQFLPQRSLLEELFAVTSAFFFILVSVFKSRVIKNATPQKTNDQILKLNIKS
jgi:ubiquinone/menaquinone biosynthesis C-methylase UbiE